MQLFGDAEEAEAVLLVDYSALVRVVDLCLEYVQFMDVYVIFGRVLCRTTDCL